MASDWTNPNIPLDVDDSGLATASDALAVIHYLSRTTDNRLPELRPSDEPFVDTNGDGQVSALDALAVINALISFPNAPALVVGIAPESDPDANGVVLESSVTFQGQTTPGVQLSISSTDGQPLGDLAINDPSGRFELSTVLAMGLQEFQFSAIDPRGQRTATTRSVRQGDIITNWNATALNAVREWTTVDNDPYEGRIVPSAPPRVARNLAMIHTAMFDAYAAIEGGFETYLPSLAPPVDASASAAAVEAAFTVSTALYPDADSMAIWNAARRESMAEIEAEAGLEAGVAFGREVGMRMLAERERDGSSDPLESRLQPIGDGDDGGEVAFEWLKSGLQLEPGVWQRTFPGYLPPLLPHWVDVEPFVVDDVTVFRPEAPPPLTSEAYAESIDEVMRLGGLESDIRTADQTEVAIFWADGGGTFTPPGHWNQIAADVLLTQQRTTLENARVFAVLNLALADAGIASWDAKYHYDLWRPIDAIQRAGDDGNPLTRPDEDWRPLLITPPFPTYTSGHSTFSGAADAVLTRLLGDDIGFSSQSDAFASPGQKPLDPTLIVTRYFASFTAAAEEAGKSRIYGGIHFDFDNTAGLQAGRAVGTEVVRTQLRPVLFAS